MDICLPPKEDSKMVEITKPPEPIRAPAKAQAIPLPLKHVRSPGKVVTTGTRATFDQCLAADRKQRALREKAE